VLDTIKTLYESGTWVEIVTLTIPGFNDSDEELTDIANFIGSVSPDIPWHVTAFHQDYKMTEPDPTPVKTLTHSAEIGYKAGLHYVYAGNRPGEVGKYEHTFCPGCGITVIERDGFHVVKNKLQQGCCFKCGTKIPGRWG
jgi:pyruvate formate lyase activating enzyme